MTCNNKHHRHATRVSRIKYQRKDGQIVYKEYTYTRCLDCRADQENNSEQFKVNRNLVNNRGLTELERELIRVLRGKNQKKNLPNIFRLNRVIESSLRKRNTL